MFTHRITQTYNDDAGVASTVQSSYTGAQIDGFDGVIPVSATNQPISVAFAVASMQSILIYASQACTLKTNSSSSPTQTITMTAGQQINWGNNFSAANPITADVTSMFVTNPSSTLTIILKIRVLCT